MCIEPVSVFAFLLISLLPFAPFFPPVRFLVYLLDCLNFRVLICLLGCLLSCLNVCLPVPENLLKSPCFLFLAVPKSAPGTPGRPRGIRSAPEQSTSKIIKKCFLCLFSVPIGSSSLPGHSQINKSENLKKNVFY